MKQFREFEKEIKNTLLDVLDRFAAVFKKIGIRHGSPVIKVWKAEVDTYESEFMVSFYRNGKFMDIIECHIFRNGKKIAELEEFKSWIEQALSDLVKNVDDSLPRED